jgi:hypothetical protein
VRGLGLRAQHVRRREDGLQVGVGRRDAVHFGVVADVTAVRGRLALGARGARAQRADDAVPAGVIYFVGGGGG